MTGEFSFYMLQLWPLTTLVPWLYQTQLQMSTKIPSSLSMMNTSMEMHFTCIYTTLFISLCPGLLVITSPENSYVLTLYRALKNYEAQGHTAIKWQGNFSKSRSWDSKSHVHSTSQQYPLQDHSCISIPEEAGQPTKLRPIKLRCPELQSTWYTTTTWVAKSQEQLHVETTCKISRKAYWWHCGVIRLGELSQIIDLICHLNCRVSYLLYVANSQLFAVTGDSRSMQ